MAELNNKNITLAQLQMAMDRVKQYTESTYDKLDHIHTTDEISTLNGYQAIASGDVNNMYVKVEATDTLNVALAKLDRSIVNITENIGSINVKEHNHDEFYHTRGEINTIVQTLRDEDLEHLQSAQDYTDTAIDKLVNGADDALDTLKEIAESLNNDPNLYETITNGLATKVAGPSGAVDKHVAVFDGTSGKLIKDSSFTIGISVPSDALFTDENVLTSPAPSSRLYLAGTPNADVTRATLGINTSMYVDGGAGKLVSPVFLGDLEGNAATSTTAEVSEKTRNAIVFKMNGETSATFDGSAAVNIDITPGSIGSHPMDYTEKAADSEVIDMLNDLFGDAI